ncbi:MAG TPA: type IV toxin-antitoxin system AbiEi family antitoxin domain-containing protein [Solirubrobacterales bacterium]|jgi:very-short-patch-repair endonuclease|nr:type IV toxin-antitoxin system AbiEi family antitoxin domain-containing protein [Solirubrobacterales bacterium]
MSKKSAHPDSVLAQIAQRQHGVISMAQLLEAGVSHSAASRRTRTGRLHRVHQGVYAVGHGGMSQEGRWMAAVLACGDGAVLSHRSAAELLGLLDPQRGQIHVSVPTRAGRQRRRGIRIHRPETLSPQSVSQRHRIPVTTAARTIADLRGTISSAQLRRAIRQAEALGLRTGVAAGEPTRSELEDLFLDLCRRHQLPKPEVNVRVGKHEVDFLWRRQRLIVETDGYRYHRGSTAFERDHDRDLDLRGSGFDLRRFTYRQITTQPDRVIRSITEALDLRRASE